MSSIQYINHKKYGYVSVEHNVGGVFIEIFYNTYVIADADIDLYIREPSKLFNTYINRNINAVFFNI